MSKIAAASLNQTPGDWSGNVANIREAIRQARDKQIEFLCLPELCLPGYGCEDLFLSTWLPERACRELLGLIPDSQGITVSIGVPVRFENKLYNCIAVLSDGKLLGLTAKQNLANDGVYYEKRWFTAWPAGKEAVYALGGMDVPIGDLTYKIGSEHLGFEICEDAWVGATRTGYSLAQRGVTLIFNPSGSCFQFGKSAKRQELVAFGSREFQCTYVYANLVGNESGRIIFDGELIIALKGEVLAHSDKFSFHSVNLLSCDTETTEPCGYWQTQTKFEEFTEAQALGLFDYMRKSRSRGFTLSLSGGADSSACLVLVNEMVKRLGSLSEDEYRSRLGYWNADLPRLASSFIQAAYLSTVNSSEDTRNSARALCQDVGIPLIEFEIDSILNEYTTEFSARTGTELNWKQHDLTLQNIQARARAPLIWMLANVSGALLITTSNRSEGSVGYTTMDGDAAGGMAVLAGVDKKFIREYLLWAETALGYEGLHPVNHLQPSAELRPQEEKQEDEKDLMPYNLLNAIELCLVFKKYSVEETLKSLRAEFGPEYRLEENVKKFCQLWQRNQWKRERIAPSFHLDEYNIDPKTWCRFPILSGSELYE